MHFDPEALRAAREHAREWARDNQWAVGLAQMALGAAAIQWSLQAGLIEMGQEIVGSASALDRVAAAGGIAGMSVGAVAGAIIGSIGIAGLGSAVAVPASLMVAGGALVFCAAGYSTTDIISRYLSSFDFGHLATAGSLFGIGTALLVDGARRCLNDQKLQRGAAYLADDVVRLSKVTQPVIVSTLEELQQWARCLTAKPTSAGDAAGNLGLAVAGGAGGALIGSSVAASSVTILGSTTLGTAALSLGLISAPLWPVIAGCAGGACVGLAAWKTAKHLAERTQTGPTVRLGRSA